MAKTLTLAMPWILCSVLQLLFNPDLINYNLFVQCTFSHIPIESPIFLYGSLLINIPKHFRKKRNTHLLYFYMGTFSSTFLNTLGKRGIHNVYIQVLPLYVVLKIIKKGEECQHPVWKRRGKNRQKDMEKNYPFFVAVPSSSSHKNYDMDSPSSVVLGFFHSFLCACFMSCSHLSSK